MYAGAVVALLGVAAALALLKTRPSPISTSDTAPKDLPSDTIQTSASNSSNNSETLQQRAQNAVVQKQWATAQMSVRAALALEPENPQAKRLEQNISSELQSQGYYDQAVAAVGSADFVAAKGFLEKIPSQSSIAESSTRLMKEVQASIPPPEPSSPQAASKAPASEKRAAKPVARPPAEPAEPKVSAKELYTQGAQSIKGGDLDGAIEALNHCVRVDRSFGQCYRALGIAYTKKKELNKAVVAYKQYLKATPDAPDAEQIKEMLRQYETQ